MDAARQGGHDATIEFVQTWAIKDVVERKDIIERNWVVRLEGFVDGVHDELARMAALCARDLAAPVDGAAQQLLKVAQAGLPTPVLKIILLRAIAREMLIQAEP